MYHAIKIYGNEFDRYINLHTITNCNINSFESCNSEKTFLTTCNKNNRIRIFTNNDYKLYKESIKDCKNHIKKMLPYYKLYYSDVVPRAYNWKATSAYFLIYYFPNGYVYHSFGRNYCNNNRIPTPINEKLYNKLFIDILLHIFKYRIVLNNRLNKFKEIEYLNMI